MKLPVYPISSFYFIRGKLSSIRRNDSYIRTIMPKDAIPNLLLRNALKPDRHGKRLTTR